MEQKYFTGSMLLPAPNHSCKTCVENMEQPWSAATATGTEMSEEESDVDTDSDIVMEPAAHPCGGGDDVATHAQEFLIDPAWDIHANSYSQQSQGSLSRAHYSKSQIA